MEQSISITAKSASYVYVLKTVFKALGFTHNLHNYELFICFYFSLFGKDF